MSATNRAYLALALICIIWGTTYTAIKYAVVDFPPFLLVGIRQTAAGLLLLALALGSGKFSVPNARYIQLQMLTGLATITGGNGFITWGMQYVSSGLASIIGSLTPIVVVLVSLLWHGKERIHTRMILGVAVGFVGLALIFREGWADFVQPEYRWGIAGCFASCFTWSLGTVMAKQWNAPGVSPLVNAGLQITSGGLGGFALSALFDTHHTIHHTTSGWISVAYLALIGSALAFTLYMFVLKHLSATISSLYTYINPVVAILLGWLLLGEALTAWEVVGMGITILGVWIVNARRVSA
ncbi:MAG: EamA family transporter [Chitinophagales bacterium]|nr:EamA family transporter [Chitinophagales bacterium]